MHNTQSPLAGCQAITEGELYGRVQSWDNGSFWEISQGSGKTVRAGLEGGGGCDDRGRTIPATPHASA